MTNDNRHARYRGRAALHAISGVRRCQDCGRRSILPGGHVELRKTEEGVVGFAGLYTCGNVWLCPVCNSKIMARRAIEVGASLTWARAEGLNVLWGSLTNWHNQNSRLDTMIGLQRYAWRSVVRSHIWQSTNATTRVAHTEHSKKCKWVCAFDHDVHDDGCEWHCERVYDTVHKLDAKGNPVDGRVGYIRAAELTVGGNGYHPHFHPIILWRGPVDEAQWFADDVVAEWVVGVEEAGGEAQRQGAQQLKVLTGVEIMDELSGYVTKSTYDLARLALEVVWSQGKTGRGRAKETTSHWSLLAAVEMGLADESLQWLEIEEATKGHRMITWSRGLRDFAGLNDEKSDEEVAAEVVGDRDDAVCVITAAGWASIWELDKRGAADLMALIMDTLEDNGWEELRALLDFRGIEWATLADLADNFDDANANFAYDRRTEEYRAAAF